MRQPLLLGPCLQAAGHWGQQEQEERSGPQEVHWDLQERSGPQERQVPQPVRSGPQEAEREEHSGPQEAGQVGH